MPTNYSGRILFIFAVFLAALWMIFPAPARLFQADVPFAQKHGLRPGIDMVGGTSLVYEIKLPEGVYEGTDGLAEEVMRALRRRVDPQGVRNLIWRPLGNTQLEIQMPRTAQAAQAQEHRQAFAAAQRQLEATNVRPSAVIEAVERLDGEERQRRLNELAMDSPRRVELFNQLAATWDQIEAAREVRDAARQAELEIEYEALKNQIAQTNVRSDELQAILEMGREQRQQRVEQLREQFAQFPTRLAAIDAFEQAFAGYSQVRGTLDDASDLKRLLRGSGVLQFHILATPSTPGAPNPNISIEEYEVMVERLQQQGPRVQANDTTRWLEVDRPEEFPGSVAWGDRQWVLAWITPQRSMVHREGAAPWSLRRAYQQPDEWGQRVVAFSFDAQGGVLFGELTRNHIGQRLAIVLDGKVISAPNINSAIETGHGIITGGGRGGFTTAEITYLVNTLNAGALPAQLADDPIMERTVGPQLGRDNLRAGLIASIAGLFVVALFLFGYYYLAGVVAMIAVLLNMVIILGAMAALDATFTLPGVAAIVLTIGMAVDANVLIFERLREEQVRGLSLRMALRNAYDKAWSAIVDSNVTTAITAAVLAWLGSEEVRGFGITLLIGLAASMFTALFVTKTIFGLLIDKYGIENLNSVPLSFPKWDRLLNPSVNWLAKARYFIVASIVIIGIGCTMFVIRLTQGQVLDIEFTSGTGVQFALREPMPIQDVRQIAADHPDLPSPTIVSVGAEQRVYEVVTPNPDTEAVERAVTQLFGEHLEVEPAARFDGGGLPTADAMGNVIVPITRDTASIAGFTPDNLAAYRGGAAIVLRNLEPQLTPAQIQARLERQRLQTQTGLMRGYRDIIVESPGEPDQPTSFAVVLTVDPDITYEADQAKWQEEVAGPTWALVNEAVSHPPVLHQVNKFAPQVAAASQRDALVALAFSLIAIMAYIWIRFGNLNYGAACVVALLHDALFVLAAIGFAHFLADTFIGRALLLDAFRINLTMIAAILTVIGYSINDTIVIFDRIRENRGKYGHLSASVINESINQTLSRTLLTSSTTIVVLFVMYIFGGAGIHGFTFALLIGILVGTYSSIAIAAPILLLTRQVVREEHKTPVGRLERVGG